MSSSGALAHPSLVKTECSGSVPKKKEVPDNRMFAASSGHDFHIFSCSVGLLQNDITDASQVDITDIHNIHHWSEERKQIQQTICKLHLGQCALGHQKNLEAIRWS